MVLLNITHFNNTTIYIRSYRLGKNRMFTKLRVAMQCLYFLADKLVGCVCLNNYNFIRYYYNIVLLIVSSIDMLL